MSVTLPTHASEPPIHIAHSCYRISTVHLQLRVSHNIVLFNQPTGETAFSVAVMQARIVLALITIVISAAALPAESGLGTPGGLEARLSPPTESHGRALLGDTEVSCFLASLFR